MRARSIRSASFLPVADREPSRAPVFAFWGMFLADHTTWFPFERDGFGYQGYEKRPDKTTGSDPFPERDPNPSNEVGPSLRVLTSLSM